MITPKEGRSVYFSPEEFKEVLAYLKQTKQTFTSMAKEAILGFIRNKAGGR